MDDSFISFIPVSRLVSAEWKNNSCQRTPKSAMALAKCKDWLLETLFFTSSSCTFMATIVSSCRSLRAPVWCCLGMHLKQWLGVSLFTLLPTWGEKIFILKQKVGTGMQKWEAKKIHEKPRRESTVKFITSECCKGKQLYLCQYFFFLRQERDWINS